MAAAPESAIHVSTIRFYLERFDGLPEENRNMIGLFVLIV
jgi:hypothetical protein